MPHPKKINKVRKLKFPIKPILEHYDAYVPTGGGHKKMKCPFHDDTVASASVDHGNQRFKCFGCEVSGDALDILRVVEGMDLEKAIALAESITGQSSTGISQQPSPGPGLFDV